MRKFVILLILLPAAAIAQQITNRAFFAYDVDKITVNSTAGGVPFTTAKITPPAVTYRADRMDCVVKCTSSSPCEITARWDGTTTLTTTNGATFYNDTEKFTLYWHQNLVNFRAIRTGANSADLYCSVSR